MLFDY